MIRFGQWLPDIPPLENPGLITATNVVPFRTHYGPWADLSVYTNALDSAPLGAAGFIDESLNAFLFAGDAAKLYRLTSSTWGDVSKAGGYTTGGGERWNFTNFGLTAIATNFSDPVQKWVLGTDSVWSDLGTDTPKARHVGVVGDFVVLGNINDTADGLQPNRVHWSPINAPDGDYTPDVDTQAGFQDLPLGNEVMEVVSGKIGTIICKTAIYRMIYVGGADIFQFDDITKESSRGAIASGSVAAQGNLVFFLDESGFYQTDGQIIRSIGADRVDEFFKSDADANSYSNMTAVVDPARHLYVLAYTSTASANSKQDTALIYNYEADRWALIETSTQLFSRALTVGVTMEELDSVSASLDALAVSLDSRDWAGGSISFGGFDQDNKFGFFGGANLAAEIETADVQLGSVRPEENQLPGSSGSRTYVTGVRALTDSATWTTRIGYRDILSATQNYTASKSPQARSGIAPIRNDARYHRAEFTIPAAQTWTYIQGFDVDAGPSSAV